jgi:hypothetical protein
MIIVRNFRYAEFREKVADTILDALAQLPDAQRSIFVWSHYRGYRPEQIAEILRCSLSEVQTTLRLTSSILYQRTRALLAEDPRVGTEAKLSGSGVPNEVGCCYFVGSSIKSDWGNHAQA